MTSRAMLRWKRDDLCSALTWGVVREHVTLPLGRIEISVPKTVSLTVGKTVTVLRSGLWDGPYVVREMKRAGNHFVALLEAGSDEIKSRHSL